jgi:CRISPR-associated endonuclease Cas1
MTHTTLTSGAETVVVQGYGLRIAIERGHLLIEDGVATDRRRRSIPRVSPLRRLVVIGHTGSVSLDALRWLRDVGAGFAQIDADASLVAVGTPPMLDDVRVRRGQAVALGNRVGVDVARALLVAKLKGQAEVLRRIPQRAAARETIERAVTGLGGADTIDSLRYVESRAAAAYWDAWQEVAVRFPARDAKRMPEHWLRFGTRSSMLNASPRKATSPANAILNYLYAVLEAEARIALATVGCDLGMGVIHSDRLRRDSFAFDLMEPVRPEVDRYVLKLLDERTFRRSDFFETREGACRLMPEIAAPLAATAPIWGKALGPLAEWCAAQFAVSSTPTAPSKPSRYRTPLTQSNRSPRERVRPSGPRERPRHDLFASRCKRCGVDMGRRARTYCDACLPFAAKDAAQKGADTQRMLRTLGQDNRSSAGARAKHRANALRQHRLNTAWEAKQQSIPSRAVFSREILPQLRGVAVATLVRATGLSTASCKRIRKGDLVPHPRHWDAFRKIST